MVTPQLSPEAQRLCQKFHLLMNEAWNCKNQQASDALIGRAFEILNEIESLGYPAELSGFHFNERSIDTELTITVPQLDTDDDRKNYDKWFAKTNGIAIDG
mgnify:CR=1 FL=1